MSIVIRYLKKVDHQLVYTTETLMFINEVKYDPVFITCFWNNGDKASFKMSMVSSIQITDDPEQLIL